MDSNNGNFNEAYEPPPYRAPETGLESERQKNQWTPGNEQAEFDAAVQSVTKWDTYNFQGAYDEAARTGKGVTFVVGSRETDDMQQTLEKIKGVQAANPGMQVVFLDTSKIAADPRLAEVQGWVDRNVKHDRTLMAQYAVRPGENGKPEGGQLISKHWGSDMTSLASTVPLGDQLTAQHKGQFIIPERPVEVKPGEMPVDAAAQTQPLDVEKQHQALQEKLKQARAAKALAEYYQHYKGPRSADGKVPGGAIAQADAIDQKAVSQELSQVSADIDAARNAVAAAESQPEEVRVKAQQQLEALRERRSQLEFLRDAPAQTRAECAQRLLAGGREMAAAKDGDQKLATEMQLVGHSLVNEANAANPGYFRSEEGKEQLRAMGYNDAAIARMTSEPAGRSSTQIADNLFGMTEQQKEELEKSGKEDQLLEKQREVLDAAIREANARNVPLVIKFGLKGCEGCDFMDGNTMQPLAVEFKENAVFASMHGFAAKQALLERGYNVEGMSFPGMEVFDVNKSGNLTLRAALESNQIVNMNNTDFAKDPARANLAPILQTLRTEREHEQNFEAVRQRQAQYEEQLRQRGEQNRQRAEQQQRESELREASLVQKRQSEQDHLQRLGFPMNNFVLVA